MKEGYYIPEKPIYRNRKTIISSNPSVVDENLNLKNIGETKLTVIFWNEKERKRAKTTFDITITKRKVKLDTIVYPIYLGRLRSVEINRKKLFKPLYDKGFKIEKISVRDTDIIDENLNIKFVGTTFITVDVNHPNILNTQVIIKVRISHPLPVNAFGTIVKDTDIDYTDPFPDLHLFPSNSAGTNGDEWVIKYTIPLHYDSDDDFEREHEFIKSVSLDTSVAIPHPTKKRWITRVKLGRAAIITYFQNIKTKKILIGSFNLYFYVK